MSKDKEEKILVKSLENLIGDKFGEYAKYIIQDRALPDLRDGLKPVQRRILYSMYSLKLFNNTSYKKSARIVGDVIGKYHPHGDVSVYEAMVRMSQEWKLNLPLIDMHGNKGSIDGDPPAAMRYTETRLQKVSNFMLSDLEKKIISFSPNFDDSEFEPTILPVRFPNVLINGSIGIAAGYSTNIPPHNLQEIISGLIYTLKNENNVTLSNLMKYIKGPDFPTGGVISSKEDIKNFYKHGKGKIIIRSKIEYIKDENELVVTEIPFEINKSELVRKVDELVKENKLSGIKSIQDDTDRTGLRISLKLVKGIDPETIINHLFKKTDLQRSYSINMTLINNKKPQLETLVGIMTSFSDFQINLYQKLFSYELKKNKNRLEIVDGLMRLVDIIDEIIKLIRASKNKSESKEKIIERFNFTERQAEAIVSLRLYRLTSTDINDLLLEKGELQKKIEHYNKGLSDKTYLVSVIISILEEFSSEFERKRNSKIEDEHLDLNIDEKTLIVDENVGIVITKNGYVFKISESKYKSLDFDSFPIEKDDSVVASLCTSTRNSLTIFSNRGRYYSIPIYKLVKTRSDKLGDHLTKYFDLGNNVDILKVIVSKNFFFPGSFLISTFENKIKQIKLDDFKSVATRKGLKYISILDDDLVNNVEYISHHKNYYCISLTQEGYILKYELSDIPILGFSASGVKNFSLHENDKVVSSIVVEKDVDSDIKNQLVGITSNGKGKRIRINELKLFKRGSMGFLFNKRIKSNPFSFVGLLKSSSKDDCIIIDDLYNKVKFQFTSIPISNLLSGLSKITKSNVISISNNSLLNFLNEKEYFSRKNNVKSKCHDTTNDEVNIEIEGISNNSVSNRSYLENSEKSEEKIDNEDLNLKNILDKI